MGFARVIAPVAINGLPRHIGEEVEVDANTLKNLIAKNRLEEITSPQPLETEEKIQPDNREKEITRKRRTR